MKDGEESQGRSEESESQLNLDRRSFLQAGALAAGGAALAPLAAKAQDDDAAAAQDFAALSGDGNRVAQQSIRTLQRLMSSGQLNGRELLDIYLRRIQLIDKGLDLNAIIQLNPDARSIAAQLDQERKKHGPRGPLHGIPILLKDNIDTGDKQQTTAGSLALVGKPALQDATVTKRLRDAGAVIIGKANLSEWANFRGNQSSSGWSGVGGQCRNPHILDRNPCGSSSGSGAATAAALTSAALATETDGSIVCPAGQCGVAGIKPTVGLTSRAGVVPISHTQDTVGTHGRSLADAAAVLGALTGPDPRDPQTAKSAGHFHHDYTQFLDRDGLEGARIGVGRQFTGVTPETDAIFEDALKVMSDAGATLVDVEIPSFDEFNSDQSEIIVLIFEFKRDLNAYLATRKGVPARTLAEVIQFNLDHADQELKFFGQELMELAEGDAFTEEEYQQALIRGPQLAGAQGIDATLKANNVQAIIAPTNTPAWPTDLINGDAFLFGSSGFAAVAGYPLVTVTGGFAFDLPVGITFMASAWSEPTLIKLASGFEAAAQVRQAPTFKRTFNPEGTSHGHNKGAAASMDALVARSASKASSVMQRHAARLDPFLVPRLRRLMYL
jgi:amidase